MVLCDNIVCVVVAATVLTCGRPLSTVMLHVFLNFAFLAIFMAAKRTLFNDTAPCTRMKMVLEVHYRTHPFTSFVVVLAAYFETIDLPLEIFILSSSGEYVWLTTNGTLAFAYNQQFIKACVTHMVPTISEKWFSEYVGANSTKVLNIWLIHKVKRYCFVSMYM